MKKEPKIDQYIEKAAPFAQPVLKHLRELIHQTCPQVEEKIKWSFPHFDYKGPFLSMAAFKQHCAFTFWKADLIEDPEGVMDKERKDAMGHFGKITSLDDLPPDSVICDLIKEAMKLNDEGIKLPQRTRAQKDLDIEVPDWFMEALKGNRKALETFESFPYSHKKEYVEWVTEAKRYDTRKRRLKQAVEWLSEGKNRNWKYQ